MNNNLSFGPVDFQRAPGGRRGCGCCGLWLAGLLAFPLLVVIALAVVI